MSPNIRAEGTHPMTGTMAEVWLAAAVFVAGHFGISSTALRGVLVARLGEQAYNGLYSLIAVAALAWLILACTAAPPGQWLWFAGNAGPYVAIVALPVALLLLHLHAWLFGVSPCPVP